MRGPCSIYSWICVCWSTLGLPFVSTIRSAFYHSGNQKMIVTKKHSSNNWDTESVSTWLTLHLDALLRDGRPLCCLVCAPGACRRGARGGAHFGGTNLCLDVSRFNTRGNQHCEKSTVRSGATRQYLQQLFFPRSPANKTCHVRRRTWTFLRLEDGRLTWTFDPPILKHRIIGHVVATVLFVHVLIGMFEGVGHGKSVLSLQAPPT